MDGRLGYTVAGVSYALLAFGAFQLVAGTGASSATKSTTATTQDVTAQLLTHSFGVALTHTTAVWPGVTGYRCTWTGCLWCLFFRRSILSPRWFKDIPYDYEREEWEAEIIVYAQDWELYTEEYN